MASKIPFQYANSTSTPPTPTTTSFTLNTTSSTDIWRKPPTKNVFTAPILYKTLPLSTFLRARVSVTAEWATLYDQGGLVFILPQPDGSKKWIKSGIEFYKGAAYVSTVAADNWADWSLVKADGNTVTLEFERLEDEGGDVATLWVYVVDKDGKGKMPVREVTWALNDPEGNAEVWVGVYVAKPTASAEGVAENLEVSFTGFELDVSS